MRRRWTEAEKMDLTKNYSEYPLEISPHLVLIHGKAGCYSKAGEMGLSHMLRKGHLDLSSWSEPTKAYIAGIIDGEGTIMIIKSNQVGAKRGNYVREHPVVTIANTSYALLDYLNSFEIGGYSTDKRKGGKGNHKQCFQWCLASILPVYSFLKAIHPYLIIKKDRAEHVMAWIEERYDLS